MNKYILAAIALSVFFATEAFAQCNTIVGVSPNIYKQSAPLRKGGRPYPAPLVGYRKEPTFIDNQGVLPRGNINVYNSENELMIKCPWASAIGHKGRARCTANVVKLRNKAIATTAARSPAIRFQLKNGRCAHVPDAGRCVGSNKGLCDRLITR